MILLMREKYLCFIILFFYARGIELELTTPQWIVWNVGQGQWVTYVQGHRCWHFDFGGEKNPIKEVYRYCSWRENRLVLSHPDRDHYIFLKSIHKTFAQICLEGPSWNQLPLKRLGAHQIPKCPQETFPEPLLTRNSFYQIQKKQILFQKRRPRIPKKDKNLLSQIFHSTHWLIPGDAPQIVEKDWLKHVSHHSKSTIQKLLLGHHGSKTSTSLELLQNLPRLRQCISSSREKKYGHPHRDVRNRVKPFCSLIRTEDWNHLHYLER